MRNATRPAYVTMPPPPALAGVVERLWAVRPMPGTGGAELRLPDGASELVVRLDGAAMRVRADGADLDLGGAAVAGVQSRPFLIDTSRPMHMVGAHFAPGGAFPFLGVRADELHNRHVRLDALWGAAAGDVRERIGELTDPVDQLAALGRALEERLARFPGRHRHAAVPRAVAALPGASSVGEVADEVGLSRRRFIDVFRREVGLTPRLFLRLRRFQAVLVRLEAGDPVDWADTALSCGYYDQAHCIRDFRAFAALTPGRYASTPRQWRNHVPV